MEAMRYCWRWREWDDFVVMPSFSKTYCDMLKRWVEQEEGDFFLNYLTFSNLMHFQIIKIK